MQDQIEIVLNTHSSCNDAIVAFVGQLEKHWPNHPPVVVGHDCLCMLSGLKNYRTVDYSPAKSFTGQYLMMLAAINTPFCLTAQDDFLLYDDVDESAIRDAIDSIGQYSCVRLIDSGRELEYSMQASVWATQALKLLYASAELATPWEAELSLNATMKHFGMKCLQRHDDDLPMRGRNHRDSPIFPYVSTAINKGKWNVSEYPSILPPLLEQYGIDPDVRGTV